MVEGTSLADTITGTAQSDYLFGYEGNDTITDTGGGANVLYAGAGDDNIVFAGAGVIYGGQGADTVAANGNGITFYGEAGSDSYTGRGGSAYGGDDNDTLRGGNHGAIFDGGAGDDSLFGDTGNANATLTMIGGVGNDYMAGGTERTVYVFNRGDGQDTIVEEFWSESNRIEFGAGIAPTDVQLTRDAASVYLTLHQNGFATGDRITIQDTFLSGGRIHEIRFFDGTVWTWNDVLAVVNTLNGTSGDDVLSGYGDNTTINGYAGNDTITDSGGSNTIDAGEGDDRVTLTGSNHTNTVVYGGDGADVLSGGGNAVSLYGGAGNDTLSGGGTAAVLDGGDGNDSISVDGPAGRTATVTGGRGNDAMSGGNEAATYRFNRGDGQDTIAESIWSDTNPIVFGEGITPADVQATRDATYGYLTLFEGGVATADRIRFEIGGGRMEVRFTDGTVWTWSALLSMVNTVNGTPGDDTLTGYSDNTTINGYAGNDTITDSGGSNTIDAGEGDDRVTLTGSNQLNNVVYGGDGADVLAGGGNALSLYGGAGNDTLSGGGPATLLDGGEGDDSLTSTGNASHRATLIGGPGNDVLRGFLDQTTYVFGRGDGQDVISDEMWSEANYLVFGAGIAPADVKVTRDATRVYFALLENGLATTDRVTLDDAFVSTRMREVRFADGAVWTWDQVLAIANTIHGTSGDDSLIGYSGSTTIHGYEGNDQLDGGAGADTLLGGVGNDTYLVDDVGDVATELAGEGTDLVQSSVNWTLGENLEDLTLAGSATTGTGNALDNVLTANDAWNTLIGNAGNDVLDGRGGGDSMSGGTGNDLYVVDNASDTVNEQPGEGIDTVQSSIAWTLGPNVENLALVGIAAINATGNGLDNVLIGNGAANTLTGGDGNDVLDGGAGADSLIGGAGDDSYYVNAGDTVSEAAGEGVDAVYVGDASWTLGSNIENLTLTGNLAINATGNTLANVLRGNDGVNTLTGGAGDDSYYVGAGDTVVEGSNQGTDTIFAGISWTLGTNVENLTLLGTANIDATGNTLVNVLTGNVGNNILSGGSGADQLAGGTGDDTYVVDSTGDVVTEAAGAGTDTVQSSVTHTLAANVENLMLTGTGRINGTGNALDNVLTGGGGTNVLTGGAGNDTYVIGSGDSVVENAAEGEDLVRSSVTHTLAANVEHLILTGTALIHGTGQGLNNLLRGNIAANTLSGAAGNDILEGGEGNDTLGDTGGANFINGQAGTDTLNGSTGNELLAGGAGNDTINTGAGADIIAFNRGDGSDTVAISTVKDNTVSLGGGITYAELFLEKSGNNLLLRTAGAAGAEALTFTNWYSASANRSVLTLQMVIEASTDFDAGSADALRNRKTARFNFDGLVTQFDAERAADPGLTTWALSSALASFHLAGSDTEAVGGDLAYRYGLSGNLAAVGTVGAQNVLAAAPFGTGVQAFQSTPALQEGITRLS